MGVHEKVIVEITNNCTRATVRNSASEKSARAKLQKTLKDTTEYKNGWYVWIDKADAENEIFTYDISNYYKQAVEAINLAAGVRS